MQRRAGETSESLSLSNPKCIKGKFSLTEQNFSGANFKEGFWGALEGFFFVMEIQPDLILGSRDPFKGVSDKAAAGWCLVRTTGPNSFTTLWRTRWPAHCLCHHGSKRQSLMLFTDTSG